MEEIEDAIVSKYLKTLRQDGLLLYKAEVVSPNVTVLFKKFFAEMRNVVDCCFLCILKVYFDKKKTFVDTLPCSLMLDDFKNIFSKIGNAVAKKAQFAKIIALFSWAILE